MNKKIGIGVIGVGAISRHHFTGYKNVSDRANVVAICDIDPVKAEQAAKDNGAKCYTDYHQLLNDPDVDAVDIILPHTLHYPVAKDCILAKKHVLMEKPMTVVSADALDLIHLAQANGVKFTVAENTRFIAGYTDTENIIHNDIGDIRFVRTFISGTEVYRLVNTDLWKGRIDGSGGGSIIDAGAHSFFLLKWMFGEIEDVQVFKEKLVPQSQVEDNAIVAGHFKKGGIFAVETSFTVEAPWNERLEVYGSTGTVIVDQLRNPPVVIYHGRPDVEGSTVATVPYNPTGWKYVSIAAGASDFVNAIWEDRPTKVNPMDGYYAVRVIEKAYESASLGAPVKI